VKKRERLKLKVNLKSIWIWMRELTAMDEATFLRLRLRKHHSVDEWNWDDVDKCSGEMNQVVEVNDNHNEACANLGRLFFKYRSVFNSDIRCFSGRESGSSIMQINEQKSLPPIAIVTIFQSYLKLTLRSCLILFTRDLALAMKRGMCEWD
jgi:hypothetical protein